MVNLLSKIDALLITDPINIRYLTGFIGVAPEERESYVLLTQNQTYLFTNSLYLEQAKKISIDVVEISRENPLSKKLAEVLKRCHLAKPQGDTLKGVRLGFEEVDVTVAEYEKLKQTLKGVALVPTRDRVERQRMIKRDDEIENIRSAAKITDQCFSFILGRLKPAISESEVAWEIESFFRSRGAELAFAPIVAFGSNSSMPHYWTSDTRLRTSDIILLDFGAKVNGYCSDMTRVLFVGKPKDEWKRAYEVVLEAQIAALENILNNPDKHSREVIQRAEFSPYPHSLGHGVGLAIHEQPRLSYKKDAILLPGMVITIEPAIYKVGSYGIRIEDLVLLKDDGIEILSKSPKKLLIL
jgi:Xaa-Pro aminopeptidase